MMKSMRGAGLVVCLLVIAGIAGAQSGKSVSTDSNNEPPETGIPMERIIAAVAHNSGRKYLIDPRVRAHVQLIGEDVSNITPAELATILQIHGFTAAEGGGYVLIVPDAATRVVPSPLLSENEIYPDAQPVSAVIPVRNGPAGYLVPILRPLMPQYADLSAVRCSNSLLIVDRFANVKRIESLVKALDVGTPYKPEKCVPPNPASAQHDAH
jgi:type II secretory pathway component GspD/PulD (secretin)